MKTRLVASAFAVMALLVAAWPSAPAQPESVVWASVTWQSTTITS